MNFFRHAFRGDPTRSFQEEARPLLFDLSALSLNGVRIGEAVGGLSFLGGAEDSTFAKRGSLHYYRYSLSITVDDEERILDYALLFEKEADETAVTFPGSVYYRGERLELSPQTDETTLCHLFGEPSERAAAGDSTVLVYDEGERVIEITLFEGGLETLFITGY